MEFVIPNDIIPKTSICLNMIVKNESHVIVETLENLCSYINFSYWVISDTGSTDNTKEVITSFFLAKNIPGEIVEHEWRDFGHNRSKALECAYNKTDYLFIFDADDRLVGDFKLPVVYDKDQYQLLFGANFVYTRPLLINNRKKWCFKGVLHESLSSMEEVNGLAIIEGNYHVMSGRTGARSQNPNKYIDDANILKKAHFSELKTDYNLSCRYAFYCAQSYKDAGVNYYDDAIEWYKKCLDLKMWVQEKFYGCLNIGLIYSYKKDYMNALKYWYKTIEYDPERIEGIIHAMNYLRNDGQHILVNALYHKFKNYNKNLEGKLFLFKNVYNDELEYHNTISAFYIHDKKSGYECCKTIILNNTISSSLLKSTISNMQFYIEFLKDDLIGDIASSNSLKLHRLTPSHCIASEEFNHSPSPMLHMTTARSKMFYVVDKIIGDICCKKEQVDANMMNIWNILFEKSRPLLTTCYNNYSFANRDNPKIIISFTTCKRLELFKQTIHSILNHWLDVDKIDYWFCVDDNSCEDDRNNMKTLYPWINYYMKNTEEKGHKHSMNIIWDKLNELKPTYWIHMEDDFLFHTKMNYVEEAIRGLHSIACVDAQVKQILFNKAYAETIEQYNSGGHVMNDVASDGNHNNSIVIHEFKIGVFPYQNCHYWPHYSFRPSLTDVKTILELGNFDTEDTFFEMTYAKKWMTAGYKTGFFNKITNRHIGRLTINRGDKTSPNAYELNSEAQFF
jgi:tetratricopeptide (TPR) repeat protein